MDETCRLRRGEGYGACKDETDGAGVFARPALLTEEENEPCLCVGGRQRAA